MIGLKEKTALVFTGILIGLLIIVQFKTNLKNPRNDIWGQYEGQKKILDVLAKEQMSIKNRIALKREEINKLQSKLSIYKYNKELKDLNELKKEIGITNIKGKGVEIIFSDSEKAVRENLDINDKSLVHASDLRDIVNLLRISGAEAVSINGERILRHTPITCVGNSIIVNKTYMLPPFNIKVVGGDPEIILNNLRNENFIPNIVDRVENHGLILKAEKKEKILLPIYDGEFTVKYIQETI